MSQTTPICSLFCSLCRSGSAREDSRHYRHDFIRTWRNVRVVSATETYANCLCERCGHTWKSKSKAAKRAMRCLEKMKPEEEK